MSMLDLYYRSAQRRLDLLNNEVQDEPWKMAHREAGECHYFELTLNLFVEVLVYFQEMDRSVRSAVYRGLEKPSEKTDRFVKGCFEHCLKMGRIGLEGIEYFEQRGYRIERADEFRNAVTSIQSKLADWTSPLPAQSPAMREEEVSDAEADELRSILNAPPGSAGKLRTTLLALLEGEPSILR